MNELHMSPGELAAVAARDALDRSRALVAGLRSPSCYPHSVEDVQVIETHISYVLLAGAFAYKIKKPVRLDFLDFSGIEERRHYCEEELRLNRRTAPDLYLDVVAIAGTRDKPVVGGKGPELDFVVQMRRFAQDDLLDHRARAGRLSPQTVDALAAQIARFHGDAEPVSTQADLGSSPLVLQAALDNFATIERIDPDGAPKDIAELRRWTRVEHAALAPAFAERKLRGFVRDCHGDLHLGNVVVLDEVPTPFDCLEFDARLRCTDVMSDVAFASMDLQRLGYPGLAARFVNAYLEHTGDYAGLRVLRYYSVHRAMVRAKVWCIRAHQADVEDRERTAALGEIRRHIELAHSLSQPARPALILMHGVSGSGKTTLSGDLLETLGAVRIRSDIERKRLHGMEPLVRSGSAPGEGIYRAADNQGTYGRLLLLAREALDDGYPVIVDATFLKRTQRDAFRALAGAAQVPLAIVSCEAPEALLRERVELRERSRTDPSEADASVLALQLAECEPLGVEELAHAVFLDTTRPGWAREATSALLRRI